MTVRRTIMADVTVESVGAIGTTNAFGYVPCRMILTFEASPPVIEDGLFDKLKIVKNIEIPFDVNKALSDRVAAEEKGE